MRERNWRQADLARASHLDPAVITNIIRNRRGPGLDTCAAIANALGVSSEIVLQAAGLLTPRDKTKDAYINEINGIYNKFTKENKREGLEFFRMLLRLQEQGDFNAKQDDLSPE
jgi:transcriptional regulator with XRE-family HTH domain